MIIDGRTGKPLRIPGVNDSLSKRCFAMESSGRLFDELPGAGGANIAFNAFNANLVKVIRGVLDKRIRAARREQLDAEVQRLVEESPQHKKLLADEARRKELLIAFNNPIFSFCQLRNGLDLFYIQFFFNQIEEFIC